MATNPRRSATRAKRITCRRIIRLRADPSRPLLEKFPWASDALARRRRSAITNDLLALAHVGSRLRRELEGGSATEPPSLIGSGQVARRAPQCPQLPRLSIDCYSALVVPLPSDPAAIRYRIYKPGFREVAPNCGSACRRANE